MVWNCSIVAVTLLFGVSGKSKTFRNESKTIGEKADAEFYVNFFCDAVICAFVRWISQKEPLPPKEFVNMMKSCIKVVAITQERMENE